MLSRGERRNRGIDRSLSIKAQLCVAFIDSLGHRAIVD